MFENSVTHLNIPSYYSLELVHFPEHIESIDSYHFTFKYHKGVQTLEKFEDGCWIELFFCGVRLPIKYTSVEDANSELEKFIKRYNNLYDTRDGKGGYVLAMIVKRLNLDILSFNNYCEDEDICTELDIGHNSRVWTIKRLIDDMKYAIGVMLWFSDAETTHNTVFAIDGEKIC